METSRFNTSLSHEIEQMCRLALAEDLDSPNGSDITAELISADTNATATLITRDEAILCGTAWLDTIFKQLGGKVNVEWLANDGDKLSPGQTICNLNGNARQMLTGERSAMNFLQSLSATATITHQYVELIKGTNCKLLDTRKTIPAMRYGQKYAVQCGGGVNHRIGLHDAYLIKENHIMACGGIKQALLKANKINPDKLLEIEVESIEELEQALTGNPDQIMLDNFSIIDINRAIDIRDASDKQTKLEASGNVNLKTIASIATTGVDYISVGSLTKDIQAVDLSLRIQLVDLTF